MWGECRTVGVKPEAGIEAVIAGLPEHEEQPHAHGAARGGEQALGEQELPALLGDQGALGGGVLVHLSQRVGGLDAGAVGGLGAPRHRRGGLAMQV